MKSTQQESIHHQPSPKTKALTKLFHTFTGSLPQSPNALKFLRQKGLAPLQMEIGFIGNKFPHHYHHKLIRSCARHGLLQPLSSDEYSLWHKDCIVFPLKNKANQIVSLYGRSITKEKEEGHHYLADRVGLYPCYPSPAIGTLILTKNILDAAILWQHKEIAHHYNILALCANNGLTGEHLNAIRQWAKARTAKCHSHQVAGSAQTDTQVIILSDTKPHNKIVSILLSQMLQTMLPYVSIQVL